MKDIHVIAVRLRRLRELREMTQNEVADMAGLGHAMYWTFESGTRIDRIRFDQLNAILLAYGMTMYQFFEPWPDGVPPSLKFGMERYVVRQT